MFTSSFQLNAQSILVFQKNSSNALQSWLSKFYNREFFDFFGRSIDWSSPPFEWSLFDGFIISSRSAIFVRNKGSYQCGNSSCNFDIWIFKDGNYVNISGNMSHANEAVEISRKFKKSMPTIFIGPRVYEFNGFEYRQI
jgi:hypothetical protein